MSTTTEKLLMCPKCGLDGFLPAGLKRHVCKIILVKPMSKTSQPPAVLTLSPTKPIDLDKLSGDQIRNSFVFDADAFGERAKAMLAKVEQLKTERALTAILAGLYLSQVKAVLGHGGFNGWTAKHFPKSKRTVEYYMALAAKFCRSKKLLLPELVGANQLSLALEAKDKSGTDFKTKLAGFVGKKGLTELMQDHGVIKRGGARPPAPKADGKAEPAEETPATLKPDAQTYQAFCDAIKEAEGVLLDDTAWSLIAPKTADKVLPLLKRLTERFQDRLQKAHHEAR